MTEAQKKWLSEHPEYSLYRNSGIVALTGWTGKGYLYPSGRFAEDDGKTWFAGRSAGTMYVGREYQIV